MAETGKEWRKKLIEIVPKMPMSVRDELSGKAIGTGFAACLQEKMKAGAAGRAAYAECAETAKLKDEYRAIYRS